MLFIHNSTHDHYYIYINHLPQISVKNFWLLIFLSLFYCRNLYWAIRFWDVNTLNQPNRAQYTEQLTVIVWELSCTQIWFEFSCILIEALIHDLSVNDHSMFRVGATLIASVSGQDIRSSLKARDKIIMKLSYTNIVQLYNIYINQSKYV